MSEWTEAINLAQYADAFEANDIEIDLLEQLDDQTLKDIGVASAGHWLRIRNAITKLSLAARGEAATELEELNAPSKGKGGAGRARHCPHHVARVASDRRFVRGGRSRRPRPRRRAGTNDFGGAWRPDPHPPRASPPAPQDS
jgi:hypothetical protein